MQYHIFVTIVQCKLLWLNFMHRDELGLCYGGVIASTDFVGCNHLSMSYLRKATIGVRTLHSTSYSFVWMVLLLIAFYKFMWMALLQSLHTYSSLLQYHRVPMWPSITLPATHGQLIDRIEFQAMNCLFMFPQKYQLWTDRQLQCLGRY